MPTVPFSRYHLRNIQPNQTLPFSIISFFENRTTKPKEGRYGEDIVVQGCRGGLRLRGERGDGGEKGEDFGTFLDRAGFLSEYTPRLYGDPVFRNRPENRNLACGHE
jgi:hypothetical protein